MFSELQDCLRCPELYERTAEKFWTDPHIAAQMLKAHLDPDTDAASRKPAFIRRSADWIASLLPKGASLLDIGCGPGLYTKQFAGHGLRVTGLDFSEGSIAYARGHDSGSTYLAGDYLAMDFENEFDMVTLIYCDYAALIPQERRGLLPRVYQALKPGGMFLLDVCTPVKGRGKTGGTSWSVHPSGGFWSPEPYVCFNASYYYGDIAGGRRHVIACDNGVKRYNLWDCYFTRQSLLAEAAPFGFSEAGFYCDVAGTAYQEDSEGLCAVLRKEEPRHDI